MLSLLFISVSSKILKRCLIYAVDSFFQIYKGQISNFLPLNLLYNDSFSPRIAFLVPLFFRKPCWSIDSLASIFLFNLLLIIIVSSLAACDIKLKVLKFSHWLALGFFDKITYLLRPKSLVILLVSYIWHNNSYRTVFNSSSSCYRSSVFNLTGPGALFGKCFQIYL